MTSRGLSAAAWGAVGALLVGVLAQGAALLGVGLGAAAGTLALVAVVVGVVVAAVTYVVEPRLERKGRA